MRIGQIELDEKELLIIGASLGLAALFGNEVAKEISKRAGAPLKGLTLDSLQKKPLRRPMKTIIVDELVDDNE